MLKLSPKIIFLISSFVLLTNQSVGGGAKLKCEYGSSSGWTGLDRTTYYCKVIDNGIFTDARVKIDSVEGLHAGGKTNKNVNGFVLSSIASMKFFPKNLENILGELILIRITSTNLQEIKQDDLKVFTKLRCLHLFHNKITTIDANLFEFNPELTGILLYKNQISHIDPNVFDHLINLHSLCLSANKCKNALTDVRNSRPEVLKQIQRVRNAECSSDDVLQRQKAAQEKALKKTEQERTKNEQCQSLSSVISEKSELVKQISNLEEKLHETENVSQEKVKICEASNAELNLTIQKLQEKIEQQKNEEGKIQATVQELTATIEKQAKDLKEYENVQKKIIESELSNGVKINEFRVKYENILQSKLELYDKYTNVILNKQTEVNECNNKYANLQNTKLIESERVNHELNEEMRNTKNIDGSCMILKYGDNQQPIILVN